MSFVAGNSISFPQIRFGFEFVVSPQAPVFEPAVNIGAIASRPAFETVLPSGHFVAAAGVKISLQTVRPGREMVLPPNQVATVFEKGLKRNWAARPGQGTDAFRIQINTDRELSPATGSRVLFQSAARVSWAKIIVDYRTQKGSQEAHQAMREEVE